MLEAQLRGSDAWYLLQLAWHLAARVGYTRRLNPENARVADVAGAHGQALEVSHPGVSKSFLGHGKMGKMGEMGENGGKWGKMGGNGGKRGKTGGDWGEMRGYGMPEHACSPLLLL